MGAAIADGPPECVTQGQAGSCAQVPTDPATSHAMQVPAQALLQQTPLTQNPLAHALPAPQAAPLGSAQAGSCAQVPTDPATSHAMQVPAQALLQQTPLTQNPLAHALPAPQPSPLGR